VEDNGIELLLIVAVSEIIVGNGSFRLFLNFKDSQSTRRTGKVEVGQRFQFKQPSGDLKGEAADLIHSVHSCDNANHRLNSLLLIQ
jgi:hypothetical protein